MENMNNKDFEHIRSLADEIHNHIIEKDIDGIIKVMNKLNSKIEFELLCVSFYNKYKFSLYNKIWNFINIKDYEKLNFALRKSLDN